MKKIISTIVVIGVLSMGVALAGPGHGSDPDGGFIQYEDMLAPSWLYFF